MNKSLSKLMLLAGALAFASPVLISPLRADTASGQPAANATGKKKKKKKHKKKVQPQDSSSAASPGPAAADGGK